MEGRSPVYAAFLCAACGYAIAFDAHAGTTIVVACLHGLGRLLCISPEAAGDPYALLVDSLARA